MEIREIILTFLDTMASKMENILTNPGLIDIREQIFGHFDRKTLKNCRKVFTKKYGEDWDLWLKRLILVRYILEFGDKKVKYAKRILSDAIPGWDNAVKKFGKTASLEDLNEVKRSLKELLDYMWYKMPLHYAAMKGHVKLMELLFHTDLNINDYAPNWKYTPFTDACYFGRTEIVNLMITSSKVYGIDLNISNNGGSGFFFACCKGLTEIVNLIIAASKEHGIDLNARCEDGLTGLMYACSGGHTEMAKLMIENRAKYGINIQQEDNSGRTELQIVNEEIEGYVSEEKEASLKELKHILEKAYVEDNEPQPTVSNT